jgi:pimeloyl-ACP methyl ester carboxylesterase
VSLLRGVKPVKWMKRIVLGLSTLVALVLFVGLSFEQWSRISAARAFPPPGELVEVNGRRAHLYCTGEGSPTVIMEAGLDSFGAQVWGAVQPAIASTTRVCSYDRAGIMWSEPGPEPRDAHRIADDLQALLKAAQELPPYVMVGHSLGGLLLLVYDKRHPGKVSGFVFVDSSHPEQIERLPAEVLEAMDACTPSPLLAKVLARLGVVRMMGWMTGEGLQQRSQAAASALGPQSMVGVLRELTAVETIASQASAQTDLGSRPVVVVSAGIHDPPDCADLDQTVQREMDSTWSELQEEIAGFSTSSERRLIENSAHYIQLEVPEAVVAAVRDVVTAVRRGTHVRGEESVPGEEERMEGR